MMIRSDRIAIQYQYSVASWTPVPHFHGARSPSDSDEHTTPENRAVTGSYPALTAADVDFSAPYVFQTTTSSFPLSKSDYRKQRRFFKLDRSATFYHNFFFFCICTLKLCQSLMLCSVTGPASWFERAKHSTPSRTAAPRP